jgi:hypothetical protein
MYCINTSYNIYIYIAFCGDICNTNFGGAARRGANSVFAKQKTSNLKMNI